MVSYYYDNKDRRDSITYTDPRMKVNYQTGRRYSRVDYNFGAFDFKPGEMKMLEVIIPD